MWLAAVNESNEYESLLASHQPKEDTPSPPSSCFLSRSMYMYIIATMYLHTTYMFYLPYDFTLYLPC